MAVGVPTSSAISDYSACARLLSALKGSRLYIGTILNSNATQTSGSYWAGLRNGFRTRGYPNWGSRCIQPSYNSWAAAAPGSAMQIGQDAFGGYIDMNPANLPIGSFVTTGAPAAIQAYQSFHPGINDALGGTKPIQSGATTEPSGFGYIIHGVESGKATNSTGGSNGYAAIGNAADTSQRLGNYGVDPIAYYGSFYRYDGTGRLRGFIRIAGSPYTRLATLDSGLGVDTSWKDFVLTPSLTGAINGYEFKCATDDNGGGNQSVAQVFIQPGQWVRTDLTTGIAVGEFWNQGGKSLLIAAATIVNLALNRPLVLEEQLRCAIRSDPNNMHVCIYVKHGHNDVNETALDAIKPDGSTLAGVKSNTAQGHTQNLETVLSCYRTAWMNLCSRLGLPNAAARFHCVSGGLHDAGGGYTSAFFNYYQNDAAWFAANRQYNGFAINGNLFGSNAELNAAGYVGATYGQNHMGSSTAYNALGLWEVQSMEAAARKRAALAVATDII